jgi:hypothetical protein
MNKKLITAALGIVTLTLASCSGMRQANGHYTVHAESFRFFGICIPADDQETAAKLHAEHFKGGTIITQGSTPADWTSFWGVLGNIFGFHSTVISGKTGS